MADVTLTLPDGSSRSYASGVTPAEVAADIAKSLAKAAISARVDGTHWDLHWPITADAQKRLDPTLNARVSYPMGSAVCATGETVRAERFFAPWQVIKVASFALSRYTTPYGHQVIISELLWVWLPGIVLMGVLWWKKRR